MKKTFVLMILDGWGIAPAGPGNAVTSASLPNYNKLWVSFPHTRLLASGEPVGLPHGEKGNSETGHLNLGAGRIVYQDLPRINMSIADGSFYKNGSFLQAFEHVKKYGSSLHLMGLIGQGGVHSSNDHLFALLHLAVQNGLQSIFLHLFTDGRDSPPVSAAFYINQVEEELKKEGTGQIAILAGRYYALDRDNRWERTRKTYEALVEGKGLLANSAQEAVQRSYEKGKTDEFIEPTIILNSAKKPVAKVSENDAVIFFNYRIDRPRQLTKAFVLNDLEKAVIGRPSFDPYTEKYYKKTYLEEASLKKTFSRPKKLANLFFVTMTEYENNLPVAVAFPPISVKMPLARVLSERNKRQLHLSETEKERFVTYYFNGQNETKNPEEDWIVIPSANVQTYDLKPEMSAPEITKMVLNKISLSLYDFILINFANPDMVGHTGVIQAGITACETVDKCLGEIADAVLARDGTCIVTADHGNVEEMINLLTGGVDTEHSANPVPFILIDKAYQGSLKGLPSGILADVAPTVLKLMNIPKPNDFTGRSLI